MDADAAAYLDSFYEGFFNGGTKAGEKWAEEIPFAGGIKSESEGYLGHFVEETCVVALGIIRLEWVLDNEITSW